MSESPTHPTLPETLSQSPDLSPNILDDYSRFSPEEQTTDSPDAFPLARVASLAATQEVALDLTPQAEQAMTLKDKFLRSRVGRLALTGLTALGLAGGMAVLDAAPAFAESGPVYTVVNPDHDGTRSIYDRNSPSWADSTRKAPDFSFYGDRLQLICGTNGEAVGPYNNRRWHYANNLSRPEAGTTWIPDRYLNTPNKANQATPGERECGSTGRQPNTPAQTPTKQKTSSTKGYTVFYSPDERDSPAHVNMHGRGASNRWNSQNCSPEKADDFQTMIGRKPVNTLAGWSIGRLGPIYFLQQVPNGQKRDNIQQIVLFDPGSKAEYENNGCDQRYDQSATLAKWLDESTTHHLTILSGEVTADRNNPSANHGHAGIQNALFTDIRGKNISRQVVVCNYVYAGTNRDLSHEDTYNKFSYVLGDQQPDLTKCPTARGVELQAAWHP